MGRLLIFTAGASLFENLLHPQKRLRRPDLVEGFRYRGAGAWRTILHRAAGLRDELAAYAGIFAPFDLAAAGERLCATAEVAGLYLLRARQPDAADRLVLLCSDTGEGAFCALANAMLLGQEVRYYPRPGYYQPLPEALLTLPGLAPSEAEHGMHASLLAVRLPAVEVIAVRKLDASRPEKFERQAIPALIQTIAGLHYNRSEAETILNYTGGFKAAIPTLAQAAAIAENIRLKCLYEDASALITQPLIQIELGQAAETRLLAAGDGDDSPPAWLARYPTLAALNNGLPPNEWAFYEEADGGVRFSSLGLALRELLQARARSLGMQP